MSEKAVAQAVELSPIDEMIAEMRAGGPAPFPEDPPLIDGPDDLHTLWCVAQAVEAIRDSRESLSKVEQRLDLLEKEAWAIQRFTP